MFLVRAIVWLLRLVRLLVLTALVLVLGYIVASVVAVKQLENRDALTSAPTTGRFTQVGDLHVFSQSHGDGKGAPVLLVHGTAAWSGTWFSLIPALTKAGHRVIAVDLPPFGYSTKATDTDFSRPAQAARLLAVLDAYGIERAIVVGHSFGGGPALELALTAPDRVHQLVLVDAALGLGATPADPLSPVCVGLGVPLLRMPLVASTAANPLWSRKLLEDFVWRKEAVTQERLAAYREPAQLRGATLALGAWGYHFACEREQGASTHPERIRRLAVPMTLIWGAQDTITPLDQARRLQALVPSMPPLVVIDGVGHIPHIEDAARFEAALIPRLSGPAAAAATSAPSP